MDKFGIFNLLGSLLNKATQENSTKSDDYKPSHQQNEEKSASPLAPPLPLQAGMINTMTSHDEFIKRVKKKNKK